MSIAKQINPAAAAELFIIQDQIHEPMHDRFLWTTMQRRHKEAAAIPEWEELREIASKIKEHTLTHLDHYLEEFEANAKKRGAHVHWALDATDHNQIVYSILHDHGVKELIVSVVLYRPRSVSNRAARSVWVCFELRAWIVHFKSIEQVLRWRFSRRGFRIQALRDLHPTSPTH